MPVFFAYDGSINGDWVSHYAVRMAAHAEDRALSVVHVEDGTVSAEALAAKLAHVEKECRHAGVGMAIVRCPLRRTVAETLAEHVPPGRDRFLVCGARVRPGRQGLLAGTVSERLLGAARWQTVALRVVQPGLLGSPRDILVPLARGRRDLTAMLPLLGLLAPDVARIHVLVIEEVRSARFRHLLSETAERLLARGHAHARVMERSLATHPRLAAVATDALAAVSDTAAKEIAIVANRTKARLVCVTAAARDLRGRFLYGNPLEDLLREAPCDVAVVRSGS
jgi:nucleotide-binding universal stress UspA family protein